MTADGSIQPGVRMWGGPTSDAACERIWAREGRSMDPGTPAVASGYGCRQQITQCAGRNALRVPH